jgi:hypothetical protein
MGFIVKLILVLAVVAGGVWAWMTFNPLQSAPEQAEVTVAPPPPPPPAPSTPGDVISASGSTDAALQGDLSTLDAQVDAAQTANSGVEQSFSDQPVKQTE